jgi:3-hydroxyisobutyrate dehydrogenase-like beta-hydroxyacid dehydrogenase
MRELQPGDDLTLGFIGLGNMGGPMAKNLVKSGYRVIGFDRDADRLAAATAAGVTAAEDAASLIEQADVVLSSMPHSKAWVALAEQTLLPHTRGGQIVIDVGTVAPPETRRLAGLLAERGVTLVDAPVSGGPGGAEAGTLRIWVGGDEATVRAVWPILQAIGHPDQITHLGPVSHGQIAKGVNQLAMGLAAAAYMEAIGFGVRAGLDVHKLRQSFPESEPLGWDRFQRVLHRIDAGEGEYLGVKWRELPYFLREAAEQGFDLPLTQRLRQVCDEGEPLHVMEGNVKSPSYWRELMRRSDASPPPATD